MTAALTTPKAVYSLKDSFILDSAATGHVCNDRPRMINLRDATENDQVYAGNILIPIEAFESVMINVSTPTATGKVNLANVALISSFHTNIVALSKFVDKDITWNVDAGELTAKSTGKTFCFVERKHSHYVLEYQPISASAPATFASSSAAPRADKAGDEMLWHRRMGHPGPAVMEHLNKSVIGITLKNRDLPRLSVRLVLKAKLTKSYPDARIRTRQRHPTKESIWILFN